MDNSDVWRLIIAAHSALFLNYFPIFGGNGITYNAADNIVKAIRSKQIN